MPHMVSLLLQSPAARQFITYLPPELLLVGGVLS